MMAQRAAQTVTATARSLDALVTNTRLIRPPDAAIDGTTLRIAPYDSAEAARRFIDLAFRDAHTCIDLTYAAGCFWKGPTLPGLDVTTNNINPSSNAALHLDFTATGLPDDAYDLVVYDPPHLADLGADSIMGRRFGTVKGTPGLRLLLTAGMREAWRIARVGILVKLADHSHGGEFLQLSHWVYDELAAELYFSAHTYRPPLRDGKWRAQRVPRNNGADWLIFRKDGGKHHDFDQRYQRQQASRLASIGDVRRCAMCDSPISSRRADAATCSATCRQKMHRQRARGTR
jgi:hypothetical protein